jgi:hypothetical protein
VGPGAGERRGKATGAGTMSEAALTRATNNDEPLDHTQSGVVTHYDGFTLESLVW